MPGPPVSVGANVILTPGAAGPPDSGVITSVPHGTAKAGGMPLATAGSMCTMVNSVTGAPYTISVGALASRAVKIEGKALLRVGDAVPSGPGVLMILGPPSAPFVMDRS